MATEIMRARTAWGWDETRWRNEYKGRDVRYSPSEILARVSFSTTLCSIFRVVINAFISCRKNADFSLLLFLLKAEVKSTCYTNVNTPGNQQRHHLHEKIHEICPVCFPFHPTNLFLFFHSKDPSNHVFPRRNLFFCLTNQTKNRNYRVHKSLSKSFRPPALP